MDFNVVYKLAIPLVFIGIGIWLKKTKEEPSSSMKKYWLLFIIIGAFLFGFRLYKYLGS